MFLYVCNYYILCHIFFEKLKLKFLKNFFHGHFLTKKNPTSKWTFFSKKKLKIDFYMCFYMYVTIINYVIFFSKKLKSFLKNFSSHFLTKKNPTSKWTFFSKKKLKFDF